jgi:predicted Fe-Mo cluster-binding NifX family protein
VGRKRRRPDDLREKAGGAGAMVSVAVVASRTEAQLIVGMLRNNNLTAAVAGDDAGGQYPALQTQGIRVLVDPSNEAAARRLLAAAADDAL